MRAFKGSVPATDKQPPRNNDEGGEAPAGDTTTPLGPDPRTTSTAATLEGSRAKQGVGAGERERGGAPVGNQAADRLASTSGAVQEPAPKVVVGGGAPVGAQGAAATAATNNRSNNSGTGVPSPGSGATGGQPGRNRSKSVAGGTSDRNKKRTTAMPKPSGGVGHVTQVGTKKNRGSTSSGAGKKTSAPPTMAADERANRECGGHAEVVEAIELPVHVLTEDNCTFWVSVSLGVFSGS